MVASAISRRLSQLQEELGGKPLFKRLKYGLEPTAAGHTLAEHARKILNSVEELRFDMTDHAKGASGVIRIYASPSSTAAHLQNDVHEFLSMPEHHKVNVHLTLDNYGDAIRKLREGAISMAVVWDVQSAPDLELLEYRSDHLAMVAPPDHKLAQRDTVSYVDTIPYDQVGIHSTRIAQSTLMRMKVMPQHNMQLRLELHSFQDCFKAVKAGIGICLMPLEATYELAEFYGLVVIPLSDVWAHRHFAIALPTGTELQPIASNLGHFLSARAKMSK